MPRGSPRRPPPSHLILAPPGPVPKTQPKHKLPCFPLPIFVDPAQLPKTRMSHRQLPPLVTVSTGFQPATPSPTSSRTLNDSERWYSHSASSSTSSLLSLESPSASRVSLRGPWNYSNSIKIDVESMLTVPKPAAVNL